ncbi:hypothetical protein TNCV_3034961 [Trichonephila clavipes]|nr:hypothetical protein TNCV_3034961 [Trichonephila clavipes]
MEDSKVVKILTIRAPQIFGEALPQIHPRLLVNDRNQKKELLSYKVTSSIMRGVDPSLAWMQAATRRGIEW